jgi:uncharacterized protein YqgV (UPF0045/DUF77 family)
VSASQHNSTHNLITKITKIIKRFTISIGLTAHTEDKAMSMAADDIISVEEAILAMAITATATVAMATIAAITITVAQTREAYREATVEEVKKDIKAFDRRDATSATNQDAGLTSIP